MNYVSTIVMTLAFVMTSHLATAQNLDKLIDSVDKEKAAGSVDQEKMQDAYKDGDVDYKKAYDAVDKQEAADSVDTKKAMEAIRE